MKNVALIIVPENLTAQQVVNNVPVGANVSWHGSMVDYGTKTIIQEGTIRVPGSIPYRGAYASLIGSQLIMLRFDGSWTPSVMQTWIDGFSISPAILVAVWYDTFIKIVDGEEISYKLRSWKVRNDLLSTYTATQIKNQLRKYFPLTEEAEEPVIQRLPGWVGMAHVEFDNNDEWLEDTEPLT